MTNFVGATQLPHAREYLAKVLPWPAEGQGGYINIHWTVKRPDRDKVLWDGRACRSVDEAARTIAWAQSLPETRDIYACQSRQAQTEERISRSGRRYQRAVRLQDNALAMKGLFLDIDAKGAAAGGYDTLNEAADALAGFIAATGLPAPSAIVNSGGGLHVYWTVAGDMAVHEWQPLAYAVVEAARRHGLRCDTACTIDSARVLRVPDTLNRKTDPARPVSLVGPGRGNDYTVERLAAALEPYKVATPRLRSGIFENPEQIPRGLPALPGVSDLSAGIEQTTIGPVDVKPALTECQFLRDALVTGGAAYSNPLWNLTTLVATFCVDGRALAHLMGRRHPGYTVESTDELYDRKEQERSERDIGWPSCRTIAGSGCAACRTCPHLNAGKSPLNFARRPAPPQQSLVTPQVAAIQGAGTAAGTTPLQDLPKGYQRRADGVVCLVITEEDGTLSQKPVSPHPMTAPWLQKNPWTLNFITVTDELQQVSVPTEIIGGTEFRKCLQGQGLMFTDKELAQAKEFFVSWIETLKQNRNAIISVPPFGWFANARTGKLEGFAYGGRLHTPTGAQPAPNPDPITAAQFAPRGDRAAWIAAAKMITDQKRPALDAIVASAFAAPLVRFTGQSGLMMSLYSLESGIGKSSAMKVAQSVWGDPVRAMQSLSDTQNSVLNKIGELRSLPVYWDELKTDEDTRRFVNLVFQLAQGKEKSRLNSSARQKAVGTWQTLLVSASNDSLLDFVINQTKTTTAGLYRVFEYEVARGELGQIAVSDAARTLAALGENFGQIGLEYASYLGGNFVTVDQEITAYMKALEAARQTTTDERFWAALVSCICMGAHYANRIGATRIDEEALRDFMYDAMEKMRNERNSQPVDMTDATNVSNVLAQFLSAMRARNTLYTNRIHVGRGKPAAGSIRITHNPDRLENVVVHVGTEDKILRISSAAFGEWMANKGYPRHVFADAMRKQFGARLVQGRIGGGTQFANATEYILQIDIAGTDVINFVDEA